jgi:carbonic anhydrase/acetyltransferase-like protein (isoleucine patch superfamily)
MSLTNSKILVRVHNWWHGTRIIRCGSGHRIETPNARMRGTRIEFYGQNGLIELGRDVRLFDCTIIMRGTAPRLSIAATTRLQGVRIVVEDQGSRLLIGRGTTMTGATLQVMEGGLIELGADCMVGNLVEVNNSDSHSLIDATTKERLNPARDVVLGDHVWLGAGVWVSKGSRIGSGSVIAARSRVVGVIPANVLAAGSPAVVKRTGISWDRKRLGVKS